MNMVDEKYVWTNHAAEKMRFYRLSGARVKRIIRHPARIEEGIIDGGVACMQPAGGKKYSEIWTMYVVIRSPSSSVRLSTVPASRSHSSARLRSFAFGENRARSASQGPQKTDSSLKGSVKIKIITAWRYPGKSPVRDPIPAEILKEIKSLW